MANNIFFFFFFSFTIIFFFNGSLNIYYLAFLRQRPYSPTYE